MSWGKGSVGWEKLPHENYEVLIKGSCKRDEIVDQIFNQLRCIHEGIGPKEYKRRWINHEFPTQKFEMLKSLRT